MFLFSALIGFLAVAGWAPLAIWPFALIAYAVLSYLLAQSQSTQHAFGLGLIFGLTFHFTGNFWAFHALHIHAGMSILSALFSTLFFAFYLSLFTAIPCGIWKALQLRSSYKRLSDLLVLPALLTLGEWARSLFFNGFTSLSLGYAFVDTWLTGYAPIIGIYGLSFLGFLISETLALARKNSYTSTTLSTLLIFIGGWLFSHVEWVKPTGTYFSYRLIQANIAQADKFNPATLSQHIHDYLSMIKAKPADLIITPETAFPVFLPQLPTDTLTELQNFSEHTGSHILLGIATTGANSEGYNSVLHIAPDSTLTQYNKIRLMPFGEYSPAGFHWFTKSLNIPLKDLNPGDEQQSPFSIHSQKIGVLICHEDSIGSDLRHWLPEATLLIMPSNLGWFEHTGFIAQNLQIVRLRALESGRPILRVANTGITAAIDHHGQITHQLPIEHQEILAGTISTISGNTPYSYWGNTPILLITILILLYKLLTIIKKRF